MLDELDAAVCEATRDEKVKAIILQGAGRTFCAGFNFADGFHQWDNDIATNNQWDAGKDMQNRHFDIAGPIPTTKELKQIDNEFISYLAARNATAVPSDNRQSLPEANQTTRSKPIAAAKPDRGQRTAARAVAPARKEARRSRQRQDCRDTPLACGWTNFTTRIKTFKNDLFGATPKETLVSRLQRRDSNR